MATMFESSATRYIGTAAEYATFVALAAVVTPGSTFWAWDTNILYKTMSASSADFKLYLTLG